MKTIEKLVAFLDCKITTIAFFALILATAIYYVMYVTYKKYIARRKGRDKNK